MSVDVRVATDDDRARWNEYVGRSPQGTLCHELEALAVQADHAGATLHPLIGFKGQEPVGLFPVFELRKGFVRTVFSPPPHLRVPYLGPAFLNMGKLKQRKREKRRTRFVDGCLEWIDDELDPKYGHVRTSTGVTDVRPFVWEGFDATPEYTYAVDLTRDEADILGSFSSDARRNVRNTADDAYEITIGGRESIQRIHEQVTHRYESQGISFDVPLEFVLDLADASANGHVTPYALHVDDEFVGGILALEYGSRTGRWMGGVRTDADVDVPTNDLLDWAIMDDARERGLETYDLVGADTRRINRYKAKFNPDLETYFSLEYGSWGMRAAASLYDSVK
ncbi:lipid II:glycine glycyltransferase FemX [Natrarchaeobaculum sulfurireducens]|uniref:Peptidoglycan interpeptide bridge formation enzyme n=1 Tax=Natrarchaeobaculum sulfurireducens TaxID=2044521 RepID=A0A346PGU2_9EURY|nr:GNAT family N-acetyltransferase [Natrarchaeobaculum sulfurireducens]AXR78737.1 Peptidoglycan interpeptide bridge formation enzyme [Natrarchaeobaculum sulfurireducens]